jgi:hypothetical protein
MHMGASRYARYAETVGLGGNNVAEWFHGHVVAYRQAVAAYFELLYTYQS